jgi:hypothetical protein
MYLVDVDVALHVVLVEAPLEDLVVLNELVVAPSTPIHLGHGNGVGVHDVKELAG